MPRTLYLRKHLQAPVKREAWWAPEPDSTLSKRHKSLAPARNPTAIRRYPVTIPTELFQLAAAAATTTTTMS